MSEGFMVKSRWGLKQHAPACPCGVCKSRRKEHIASLRSKVGEANTDVRSIAASETTQNSQASQQAMLAPHDVSTESADLQRRSDLQPAETGNSDTENQQGSTHVNRAVDGSHEQSATTLKKSALKTRFNMELAALGTPDMPLSKARVPRQAATAAKEAIKKDLLQQKSRTGIQSVPPKASGVSAADKMQGVAKASSMKPKSRQKAKPSQQSVIRAGRELKALLANDADVTQPLSAAEPAAADYDTVAPPEDASAATVPPATAASPSKAAANAADAQAQPSAVAGSPVASVETRTQTPGKPHVSGRQDAAVDSAVQSEPMPDGGIAEPMQDAQHPDSQAPALSSDEGPAAALEPQKELSPVEHFAQVVRSRAKWGPAVDVNVRGLMASAVLTGQPVHIQLRNKQPVYLQGEIKANGMVKCAEHVGGPQNHECSLSEFEKLGNSKERRPGENIHLTNYSIALKDFCALVNDIGERARSRCMECKQGSGLIKCKGCSVAAHPICVGLNSRQQQANWFCAACKATGQDKLPQRPQDLQGRARAPASKPAPKPQSATRPPAHPNPPSVKAETSCVSPAGRVHMAVPVSGMTPARRERNGNKHKRLFLGGPGGLTHGEPVEYRTAQQGLLLKGEVHIRPGMDALTGILCHCCNQVVSCSKFEAHAGQGSRRAPYDNIFTAENITLRARAAMLPPLAEGELGFVSVRGPRRISHSRSRGNAVDHSGQLGGIVDGCRDVIHDLDHDAGGCNICGRPDFALGDFCDRTMILCDQCECEFHVGCLRKADRCNLTQLPTGDWFCSEDCSSIWQALNGRVSAGSTVLEAADYTLQLMRGRDSSGTPAADATNIAIDIAQQVLQESFDPIIDKATKENLLLLMTKAEVKGEYDYRGMYTALLTHQGSPVCAAVFRAFGAQLAEVPLVATKADARRQGHCRVLMAAFETILKEAGVRTMCLPAAHETVRTWIHGFGLSPMPDEDLDTACKDLRLLIFPGTQVLQKQLLPPLPPKQGPFMTPPWEEQADEPTSAGGQIAADGQAAAQPTAVDGQLPAEAQAAQPMDSSIAVTDRPATQPMDASTARTEAPAAQPKDVHTALGAAGLVVQTNSASEGQAAQLMVTSNALGTAVQSPDALSEGQAVAATSPEALAGDQEGLADSALISAAAAPSAAAAQAAKTDPDAHLTAQPTEAVASQSMAAAAQQVPGSTASAPAAPPYKGIIVMPADVNEQAVGVVQQLPAAALPDAHAPSGYIPDTLLGAARHDQHMPTAGGSTVPSDSDVDIVCSPQRPALLEPQLLSPTQNQQAQQQQQQHGVHDASAQWHSSSVTAQGHETATASAALPQQLTSALQLQQPEVHSHDTVSHPDPFEQEPMSGLADSSATCDPTNSSQHQSLQSHGEQEGPTQLQPSAASQPSANVKSTQSTYQTSHDVQSNDINASVQHLPSQSSPSQPALYPQPLLAADDMPAADSARASTDHAIAPAGPVEPIGPDIPASQSAVVADPTAMIRPEESVAARLAELDAAQGHSGLSEHARQQMSNHALGSQAAANGTTHVDNLNGLVSNGHHHFPANAADGVPTVSPSKMYNGTVVGDVQKVLDAALWGAGRSPSGSSANAKVTHHHAADGAAQVTSLVGQKRQFDHGAAAIEGDLPSKRQCVNLKELEN